MRVLLTFILVVSSCLVGLGIIEGFLRYFPPESMPTLRPNFLLGQTYIPNLHFERTAHESGRRITFKTNQWGLRDKNWNSVEMKARKPRVVVVGDSLTAAVDVAAQDRYTERAELRLKSKYPNIFIANAGVESLGPFAYSRYLTYLEPLIKPDVIVFALFNGNDFHDIHHMLNPQRLTWTLVNGVLQPTDSSLSIFEELVIKLKVLVGRSYAVLFLRSAARDLANRTRNIFVSQTTLSVPTHKCLEILDQNNTTMREARGMIKAIIEPLASRYGRRLILLQIPHIDQIKPRFEFGESCQYELPERWLTGISNQLGFTLAQPLYEMRKIDQEYYWYHLNDAGHIATAESLTKAIERVCETVYC